MIKCIVLYDFPSNEGHFEDHYFRVHLPLSAQLPGLRRREFAKFSSGPGGERPAYYRIAELYFDDRASMQQAFASEVGQRALADRKEFAGEGVRTLWAEVDEVP